MHLSKHLDEQPRAQRLPLPPPQLPSPWPSLPICTLPLFPYLPKPSARAAPEGASSRPSVAVAALGSM